MKLSVPYNKINPVSSEKDDTLLGLALGSMALGVQPKPNNDKTYIEYKVDDSKVSLQVMDLLTSKGLIITEVPLFIEISSKDAQCPFIEGTWGEWKASNHEFWEKGNKIFIGTNAHDNRDMDWADLQVVRNKLIKPQDLPKNDNTIN